MSYKNEEILKIRAKRIQERIKKAKYVSRAVQELADEYCLSERQIYRDLKKN